MQKRPRSDAAEASTLLLDMEDWAQLAATYKLHDETRETIIKRCRDMQVCRFGNTVHEAQMVS